MLPFFGVAMHILTVSIKCEDCNIFLSFSSSDVLCIILLVFSQHLLASPVITSKGLLPIQEGEAVLGLYLASLPPFLSFLSVSACNKADCHDITFMVDWTYDILKGMNVHL